MLHSVTYRLDGIYGPGGYVSADRADAIEYAVSLANVALDQLGDYVSVTEWFDCSGNEVNPRDLLGTTDLDEVANMVGQISDTLKGQDMGHLDLLTYDDLFELLAAHHVTEWCSPGLREKISAARTACHDVVVALAEEWPSI